VQGDNGNAPTAACVDAETLAAWADGGLPKAEADAVELHLADCDRCTAMAATFARTIPDARAAEPLWTRWHLRWLVPAATAATVAALWVLAPRPDDSQIATFSRTVSDAPFVEADGAGQAPLEAKMDESAAAAELPQPGAPARRDELAQPGQPADQQQAIGDAAARLREPRQPGDLAAAPPPPAPQADRNDPRVANERTGQFAPVSPPAAAPPPRAEAASATPSQELARPTAREAAEPSAAASARAAARAPAAGPAALSAPAPPGAAVASERAATLLEIVSPAPAVRWRIVGAGQVQRSTDGGASWEAATLPESATVTGGSSPSPSVCWLVGRSGAIYVSTDGLRFARVPFPDRTDFVSIQAADGRRATVVTIDGRTMRTEDQGATWIRISP